jgi:hypothetical protein
VNKLNIFRLEPQQQQELLAFCCIALLFVFPIIQANVYFRDDLSRALDGHTYWHLLGRPLATAVQTVLSLKMEHGLLDVGSLNLVLSSLLLGLSAFIFNRYLRREFEQGIFWLSASIIINPFFLYNLSYRFDSVGMTLGLFCCVLSFSMAQANRWVFAGSVALLVAVLSLYQSSINLFIALSAVELLLLARSGELRMLLSRLGKRATQYLSATLIYTFTIARALMGEHGRNQTVGLDAAGWQQVIDNAAEFLGLTMHFFSGSIPIYLGVFALFVVVVYTIFVFRSSNKVMLAIAPVVAFFLYFVSLFGPMVLLEESGAMYRTMPSFYMFSALLITMSYMARPQFSLAWLIPFFIAFSVSFQYGVAAKNQQDYDENLFSIIQTDLLQNSKDTYPIYVIGRSNRAPHAQNIAMSNKFIDKSIRPAWGWVAAGLMIEKGLEQTQFLWSGELKRLTPAIKESLCLREPETVVENSMYSIYFDGERTFVLLSTSKEKYCKK